MSAYFGALSLFYVENGHNISLVREGGWEEGSNFLML